MKMSARTNMSLDDLINEIVDELMERSKKSRENEDKKNAWLIGAGAPRDALSQVTKLRGARRNPAISGGPRDADPRTRSPDGSRPDRSPTAQLEPTRDTRSRSDYIRPRERERDPVGLQGRITPRSGDILRQKSDIFGGQDGGEFTTVRPPMTAAGYQAAMRGARTMAGVDDPFAAPEVGGHAVPYDGRGPTKSFSTHPFAPPEPPRVPLNPDRLPGPAAPNPARDGETPPEAQAVLNAKGNVKPGGRYYDAQGEYKGRTLHGRWIPAKNEMFMYEINLMEKMEKRGYGRKLMTDVMRHHIKTRCG